TLLLELAPVDPRSLMQGDYMALRYAAEQPIAEVIRVARANGVVAGGYAIFIRDENEVGQFLRLQTEAATAADNEVAVRYRATSSGVSIASDAWFFPEGRADHYEQARYG